MSFLYPQDLLTHIYVTIVFLNNRSTIPHRFNLSQEDNTTKKAHFFCPRSHSELARSYAFEFG
jgi:hypothetical protein